MKNRFLAIMLALASVQGALYAQEHKSGYDHAVNANATFNVAEGIISQRHTVWFKGGKLMIIELSNQYSFRYVSNMDSLLYVVRDDIAFAYDSVRKKPTHNFKISYVSNGVGSKQMMIKDYPPDATYLWKDKNGDYKKLKIASDTLRITLKDSIDQCQATFILNRLSDIDSFLATPGYLNNIVDSLRKLSAPKLLPKERYRVGSIYQASIFLNLATNGMKKPIIYKRKVDNINATNRDVKTFSLRATVGIGLLRDKIAPIAELAVQFRFPRTKYLPIRNIVGLSLSTYYAFEKDNGAYKVLQNTFLSFEIGNEGLSEMTENVIVRRYTVGVGLLVREQGGFLKRTTMKGFFNISFKNPITVSPEIICTDNFRQAFPGLSLRVHFGDLY